MTPSDFRQSFRPAESYRVQRKRDRYFDFCVVFAIGYLLACALVAWWAN